MRDTDVALIEKSNLSNASIRLTTNVTRGPNQELKITLCYSANGPKCKIAIRSSLNTNKLNGSYQ